MISHINNIEDVSKFFNELFKEGINAHPDDDFADYIKNDTLLPTFTTEEAAVRNSLMNQSFTICDNADVDIYDLMLNIFTRDYWELQ